MEDLHGLYCVEYRVECNCVFDVCRDEGKDIGGDGCYLEAKNPVKASLRKPIIVEEALGKSVESA